MSIYPAEDTPVRESSSCPLIRVGSRATVPSASQIISWKGATTEAVTPIFQSVVL